MIDRLFTYNLSWSDWVWLIVSLILIYFSISVLEYLLRQYLPARNLRESVSKVLRQIRLLFVPVAVIILLLCFIAINPLLHGFIVTALFVFGYKTGVQYVSGLAFVLRGDLKPGEKLLIEGKPEEIVRTHALGVELQGKSGVRFVPYNDIMNASYVIASPPQKGVETTIIFTNKDQKPSYRFYDEVRAVLFDAPYVDTFQKIKMQPVQGLKHKFEITCRLYAPLESSLMQMLIERGYQVEQKL